jgi:DNA repair protein SbcC/Rad50
VRNFRKFADVGLEFPDGVVGVLGLNGVGKSSVFEAVAWALYGPSASRTSTDEIKRQGAGVGEPCRVEVEFVFDDHVFRVVREMVGKHLSAAATVTVDGGVVATGADAVSRFVQARLGMDCKSFYTSIFAKQKELNALSSMNPSERRPLILRMLGISLLDDVIVKIRADMREKERVMEGLALELVDETGGRRLDRLVTLQRELASRKVTLQERRKETQRALKEAERRHGESVAGCAAAKTAYEESIHRREVLEEQKRLSEQLKRLRDEEQTLAARITERQQKQAKAAGELTRFQMVDRDLLEVEKGLRACLQKNEVFVKALQEKATLSRRCEQDVREAEKKKGEVHRIGPDAKCPVCERELGGQYAHLMQHYADAVAAAEAQIVVLRQESLALEREQAGLGKQRQALEKKRQFLSSQRLEAEGVKATVRNIDLEVKREQQRLAVIAGEVLKVGAVMFNEKEFLAAVRLSKELYERYHKMLDLQNTAREVLEKQRLMIRDLDGEGRVQAEQERTLQEQIARQEHLERQLKEVSVEKQQLSMLGELMTGFRTHLISQVRPTLSAYASDLLDQLSDGKYTILEFDEDYNISVYDNGQAFGIERFSGGEEDLANLCTRLAISEIITERAGSTFNFVVLDEIFGSQDSGRRRKILSALDGFSAKFRQIFLITHIEEIKNSVEHVMSITENDDGISTIQID